MLNKQTGMNKLFEMVHHGGARSIKLAYSIRNSAHLLNELSTVSVLRLLKVVILYAHRCGPVRLQCSPLRTCSSHGFGVRTSRRGAE